MYGPVATWWRPYVDGFARSYAAAYSGGTGAVSCITSAAATSPPRGAESRRTRVWSFGVSMPGITVPGATSGRAPTMSPKYTAAYGLATVRKNPRSIAYLTSCAVTARLTGGEKRMPGRMLTVTDRPSGATCGGAAARSSTGVVVFPGTYVSSARWVAAANEAPIVGEGVPGSTESGSPVDSSVSVPPWRGCCAA